MEKALAERIDVSLRVDLYRKMLELREFELKVQELYRRGLLPGFVHLYVGEEAVAVGVCSKPEELDVDHFLCTHSHYDHADPETIGRLRKQAVQTFVGPGLACESFCNC